MRKSEKWQCLKCGFVFGTKQRKNKTHEYYGLKINRWGCPECDSSLITRIDLDPSLNFIDDWHEKGSLEQDPDDNWGYSEND